MRVYVNIARERELRMREVKYLLEMLHHTK